MTGLKNTATEYRVEEAIWGHRLHDEQSGPMVTMEFLNVLQALPFAEFDKQISTEDRSNSVLKGRLLSYKSYRRMALRTLLFNNPFIEHITAETNKPWATWANLFAPDIDSTLSNEGVSKRQAKTNRELLDQYRNEGRWSPDYLMRAFGGGRETDSWESFKNFVDVLKLIRACSFNVNSDKRWTSLFVFPWGKDCLFAETDEKGSPDKRFFGRSGELLYILLSYAEKRHELEALIRKFYFDSDHPLNRVCKVLQGPTQTLITENDGHRPIKTEVPNEARLQNSGALGPDRETAVLRRRSDLLCEDLIRILKSRMPAEDLFAHFSRIIGLHLICYFLERGIEVTDKAFYQNTELDPTEVQKGFTLFCEILSSRMNSVRHSAQSIYQTNRNLSTTAIKTYVEAIYQEVLKQSANPPPEYAQEDSLVLFRHGFYKAFNIRESKRAEYEKYGSPEEIKQAFMEKVRRRHDQHWGRVIHEYARAIGLASRSGTNRYRYCPNDELIVTLMLANVDSERILLEEFLEKIYDKYHLVIGFQGSENLPKRLNDSDIKNNVERFKSRLKSLGLLETLSDGYDFMQNTFFVRESEKEE